MSTGRRLLFSLVPLVFLVGVGEIGARLVGIFECGPVIPSAVGWATMIGDPDLLWRLEPHTRFESPEGNTQINAVGLRDNLLPSVAKAPGEFRIAVTGDSSVYGWGQPDGQTYANQLEQALNGAFPGRQFRVINLGVPGYSTEQTIRLLDQVGWDYDLDLLIVSNLFSDCNIDSFQDRDALDLANPSPTGVQRLLQCSRLYCAAYMPWARYRAGTNQETNRVLMPGMPVGSNAAVALERIDQIVDLSRVPLRHYLDNLERIRAAAESRGAGMLVAPLAQEWDAGLWRVPMPPPTPDQVLPWHPYREAMRVWADQHGIGVVDFAAAFSTAAGDNPARLFIDNMHPSVEGAAVMAATVRDYAVAHPEVMAVPGGGR